MKFFPEEQKFTVTIPRKLRCIWMNAGILSYQLCDRQFVCDSCALDAAMRKTASATPETLVQHEEEERGVAGDATRPDVLFSPHHCWVKQEGGGVVRIGIEPQFASLLRSLKSVVLPAHGAHVKENECCAWLVLDGGTLPIMTPVSGIVTSFNCRLYDDAYAVHNNPESNGWLFEIQTEAGETTHSSLLHSIEAQTIYAAHYQRFNGLIHTSLNGNTPQSGMTMHDNGKIRQDVSILVGASKYIAFLLKAFY